MQHTNERRKSTRMLFSPRAYCEIKESGKEFCGTIRDISILSIFVEQDVYPEDVSGDCDIQIVLEGQHSELEICSLRGRITRVDDTGVAIRFNERLEWFAIIPLCLRKIANEN